MPLNTIIVPYDFSDCATDALRVAASIARGTGACIDIVHLYEQMTDFHTENQKLREEIEARLEKVPQLPFLEGLEFVDEVECYPKYEKSAEAIAQRNQHLTQQISVQ